jgi:1-acyl-sn-glycerol-3-phosphate acyltransferase
MIASLWLAKTVRHLRRLQFEASHNIPQQGPVLIAATHSSPMDLFYCLALMQHIGRTDYRCVVTAEMLEAERFRLFTEAAIRAASPALGAWAGLLARVGARVVPPLLGGLNSIPIYRQGDDSESRRQVVASLLDGQLVAIAPEWGNDDHRDEAGLRPLTHGVASIARRFFDATRVPLTVVPVALAAQNRRMWSQVRVRVGAPFRGMSDRHYPELFADGAMEDVAAKHHAYQHFTTDLTRRLRELS